MKDKFASNKTKQFFLISTVLLFALAIIFVGSSLMAPEQKKEETKVELPKVVYDDKKKTEKESFKKTYGAELVTTNKEVESMRKEVLELRNIIAKQNNKETVKTEQTAGISGLSIDGIQVPPPSMIDENLNTKNNASPSVVSVSVEEDLITIDSSHADTLNNENNISSSSVSEKNKKETKSIIIPSGSFAKARLQNGIDAPTSGNARTEPHPVAIRITDKSILPNSFRADIQDCVAIGGGYGELSSDRAIIRIEQLSCIAKDGTVLASQGNSIGFVTGEDGKIGLGGRVVSKQGAIMARALVAGFIEGMGEVFKQSSTILTTGAYGTQSTIDPNKALESSLYGGGASASKKLADYYLKLNDQMFPVIEINVGRECDVTFIKPVVLKPVDATQLKPSEDGGKKS